MKYLRVFEKENNYTEYKDSGEWITPNISLILETGGSKCKPYIPPPPAKAGDVAYWDGSKVKTIPLSNWDTSLGTPVGVVVVPEGFAPDGKVRIISLINIGGGDVRPYLWGSETDRSLTNFTKVPTTDNAGSTSSGSSSMGYLPSDSLTGVTSFVDPKAKYSGSTPYIVSPYLGDEPNPEYYKELDGGNALSDFNGLSNTQTLTELGSQAANVAYRHNIGVSNLQWYLPAMGELGYLVPRFNEINNTITALGGAAFFGPELWSSSEKSKSNAYYLNITNGYVYAAKKSRTYYVRPFSSF